MTDRFKEALRQLNMIKPHLHGMGGSIRRGELGVIAADNMDTIIEALTLATEAEQLRKENEELKAKLDISAGLVSYGADEVNVLKAKLEKAKWQPIETAPYDEYVFIKTKYYEGTGFFDSADNQWFFPRLSGEYESIKEPILNWMPLLDAPEQR